MTYLAKGRKQDLIELAPELDVIVEGKFKILEIRDAILKSSTYDEEFTKESLTRIVNDRKETEERAPPPPKKKICYTYIKKKVTRIIITDTEEEEEEEEDLF